MEFYDTKIPHLAKFVKNSLFYVRIKVLSIIVRIQQCSFLFPNILKFALYIFFCMRFFLSVDIFKWRFLAKIKLNLKVFM